MQVMQDEIFGPLLPSCPTTASTRRSPMSPAIRIRWRSICSRKISATIDDVLSRTMAGGVSVNDTLYHIAQHGLPFGGVGPSGMGGYHGEAGFRTFSHMKPVFRQARLNGTGLLNPPYGARFKRMLEILLRKRG